MKINEVEAQVGITKKNIRFYEEEGLLTPRRNRENGYRDYGEAELRTLRQIKLLRKLGLPLEEIRRLQAGVLTVSDAMNRHRVALEREEKNLAHSKALTQALAEIPGALDSLEPEEWLAKMEQMEEEGTSFMNRQKGDRKNGYVGAVVGAGVMVLLMGAVIALLFWCTTLETDPCPTWLAVVMAIPCGAVAVGVLAALLQRIKEIEGGEMDAAGQY
jgi:DNA-binding transcriptional MerR regulator